MPYTVSPRVEQMIESSLASGQYTTPEEVLVDALSALNERNQLIDDLREGIADMEAGRMRPLAEVAEEIRLKHGFPPDDEA